MGFVLGTLCLVGLFAVARRGRHGWSGRFGHGGGLRRRFLYRLFQRLDATPGQEKVILSAFEELRALAGKSRGEWQRSRVDLAQALRGPALGADALGTMFARHDQTLDELRKAAESALGRVHEALDDRQRALLAELVASGGGFGRGRFGGAHHGAVSF